MWPDWFFLCLLWCGWNQHDSCLVTNISCGVSLCNHFDIFSMAKSWCCKQKHTTICRELKKYYSNCVALKCGLLQVPLFQLQQLALVCSAFSCDCKLEWLSNHVHLEIAVLLGTLEICACLRKNGTGVRAPWLLQGCSWAKQACSLIVDWESVILTAQMSLLEILVNSTSTVRFASLDIEKDFLRFPSAKHSLMSFLDSCSTSMPLWKPRSQKNSEQVSIVRVLILLSCNDQRSLCIVPQLWLD